MAQHSAQNVQSCKRFLSSTDNSVGSCPNGSSRRIPPNVVGTPVCSCLAECFSTSDFPLALILVFEGSFAFSSSCDTRAAWLFTVAAASSTARRSLSDEFVWGTTMKENREGFSAGTLDIADQQVACCQSRSGRVPMICTITRISTKLREL